MGAERRQSARLALSLKIRVDGPGGRQTLQARDVSYEGVFIESAKSMSVGSRIECRLELPGQGSERGPRVEFAGDVRHQSREYETSDGGGPYRGFGVRITRIGVEDQKVLKHFLDEHLAAG